MFSSTPFIMQKQYHHFLRCKKKIIKNLLQLMVTNINQINQFYLTRYKEYSAYPKIIKDISFIIQRDITFKELQETLYYNGTTFLSEINLLDEYAGTSIPDQQISLCLQLIFQSNEKTLQNKEIEEILKNIRFVLTNKFNAIIRN